MGFRKGYFLFIPFALGLIALGCNGMPKNPEPAKTIPQATTTSNPKPPQWPPQSGATSPIAQPLNSTAGVATSSPSSTLSSGIITGIVVDRQQRRPNNAFVQIVDLQEENLSNRNPSKFEVSADALGNFTIQGLKPGKTYQLTARVRDRSLLYTGTAVVASPSSQVVIEIQEDSNPSNSQLGLNAPPISLAPNASEATGSATSTIKPERIARDLGMMPSSMPTLAIPPVKPETTIGVTTLPIKENIPDAPVPSCQLIGKKLENFALVDLDGNAWEFRKHHKGRLILLDFWFSTCGPCLTTLPHLVTLQRTYKSYGLEIVGIAYEKGSIPERSAKVRSVRGRYGLNYTTLLGQIGSEDCPVRTQFQVTSFPTLVLIDDSGNILWRNPPDRGPTTAVLREMEMEIQRALGMGK